MLSPPLMSDRSRLPKAKIDWRYVVRQVLTWSVTAWVLAMLLALLSVAVGAWSLIIGPDSLAGFEGIQDLKLKVLSAIGRPAPPETHPAQASAPDSSLSPESSRAAGSAQAASIPAGPAKSTARDSSGVRLSSSNRR